MKRIYNLLLLIPLLCLLPQFGSAQIKTDSKAYKKMADMEKRVVKTYKKNLNTVVCLQSIQDGGAASGSGTIVSKEGLILTAAHVVGDAKLVTVLLPDGRRAPGNVLGCNYDRDVAMVQIGGDDEWPFAKIGDSRKWDVADLYVAMGHPGGFDIRRPPPVRIGRAYNTHTNKFIVSDCVVIGGDSGGPLFDLDGNLVGIHSSIGASLGQNNHAPVHTVQDEWDRLFKGDKWGDPPRMAGVPRAPNKAPTRPRLGLRLEDGESLVIDTVHPDTPAQRAGLKAGDKLLSANGKEIESKAAFRDIVRGFKIGDEIELKLWRENGEVTKTLRYVASGAAKAPPSSPSAEDLARKGDPAYFGAAFRTVDNGARISRVVENGPAAKAKFKEGDVIQKIDGTSISGPADIAAVLRGKRAGDKVEITFERDGEKETSSMTLGKKN